jgi:hypothetical protein
LRPVAGASYDRPMGNRTLFLFLGLATAACGSNKSTSTNDVDAPIADGQLPDAPVDANPNAPICTINGPANNTATAFDMPVMLAATASDLQDGALTGASVVWRTTLQVAPLGSGDMLTTVLPVGSNTITCTATDSAGLTGSASVTVVSKSPYATITHPGNNETRTASQAVPLVGVGRDKEDGNLTGASLAWASSIDGPLGTGSPLNKLLSVGVHTITLTATDSAGNVDTATITLTMQ